MKNKFKRVIALILAMAMVMTITTVSMAEETAKDSAADLMSLLPIEEVYAYIDLREIPLEKLPQMTAGELLSYLRNESTHELVEIADDAASVWANFIDEEGNYLYDTWEVVGFDESITPLDIYDVYRSNVEVIVGSGNQLDPENVRYIIDFKMPMEYASMDLSGYVYDELYDFEVAEIVNSIQDLKVEDTETVEILWDVKDLVESGYEFESEITNGWIKLNYGDSVKFAPTLEETFTCSWWSNSLRMIIKSDDVVSMYSVYATYPEYVDMFECSIYTQNESGEREEVVIDGTYGHETRVHSGEEQFYFYDINSQVKSRYSYDDEYYFGLKLSENFADCDLVVIEGWENSPEEIRSWLETGEMPDDVDITQKLFAEDMTVTDAGVKGEWLYSLGLEIMLCIISEDDIYIVPVAISMSRSHDSVDVENIFTDIDGERIQVANRWSHGYTEEQVDDMWYYTEIITFYLDEEFNVDDEYSVGMIYYDSDTDAIDASDVDKAVVGHYYSLEEAEDKPDIKEQLFAEDIYEAGGYKTKYSGEGVDFTIFAGEDIWHYKVIVAASDYVEEPDDEEPGFDEAPEVGSADRYFKVLDLCNEDGYLDTYTVPYEYDTYYSYGYQTLLVNDTEVDTTAISPVVNLGYHAKVYYGDVIEPTSDSYSNELSPRDFTKVPVDAKRDPYNSVRYTVSAEDRINQKNYWVTAVKKEEGAKLFVNGPDEREIFLNNYFGNVHDIFVANVGSEELTGITATIDATNIKIDEYWTLGGEGNNTLAPFTTTSNNTGSYRGELFNVARIRLVPDGEGEITGTLTVTADGQEPRVITLTGTAGNPKIDTESLHNAVKYVPYSAIITTNNMHDWNKVSFSLEEGELPDGLTMYPSGEIYGVPKETGEFPITIRAQYSHDEFETSYANLVLTVLDNTDENVNSSVDDGYEITKKIPSKVSKYADMEFVIDGEFEEFVDLWLDGEKLAENVDYTAISGSTKITVKSKTFSSAGKGKHTISAEFRVGGDKNNELKTASQNFTIGSASSSGGGGGGGGGGTPTYTVTFETNGGSTIKNHVVKKGSVIGDLPVPEKEGYVFAGWYKDKALTQLYDPTTKISSKVSLYAKWEEVVVEEVPVEPINFADVATADWFYEDVQWAYANKIMVGYSDEHFAPSELITSGMVVTVLSRLADVDVTAYEDKQVEGVEQGQWYTPYANWAKEVGIAEGVSFDSSQEITREMMGVVLVRFFEYMEKEFDVTDEIVEFADADLISDKAIDAIKTLYKLGIFKGKGDNKIDPLGNTTRAEFSALIHRVCTLMDE